MHSIIFIASLTVLLWSGSGMAQGTVANLKTVSGQVSLTRGGETMPAVPGGDLQNSDIINTGANGSVGVSFLDGTRVSLGPASEMLLNNYRFEPLHKDYAFDIYMKKGSAAYSSGKLGKLAPDAVKFNTPQATVGVRGTKFLVKVD